MKYSTIRPSYNTVDSQDRYAYITSRTNILSKSFVTDLWTKVITRAIEDIILYRCLRAEGKELSADDKFLEETANSFLFDDNYSVPIDDYLVDIRCTKCNHLWIVHMSQAAGQDSICSACSHKTNWKYVTYEITEGQSIKSITLKDLLSIWDVEDVDGFRKGVNKKIEDAVMRKTKNQPTIPKETFRNEVHSILIEIEDMLVEKNKLYGDSVLDPIRVCSKADAEEQIRVRMDDKLSRMVRGDKSLDSEDVSRDFVGYWVIAQVAKRRKQVK